MRGRRGLLLVLLPALAGAAVALLLSSGWLADPQVRLWVEGDLAAAPLRQPGRRRFVPGAVRRQEARSRGREARKQGAGSERKEIVGARRAAPKEFVL